MPLALQRMDHAVLLGRIHAGEDVGLFDDRDQGAVREALQFITEHHPVSLESDLGAHRARNELAVASQDLDGDTTLAQGRYDFRWPMGRAGLQRQRNRTTSGRARRRP